MPVYTATSRSLVAGSVIARTYSLLAASLALTAFTAHIGMRSPLAWAHPLLWMILAFGALIGIQFLRANRVVSLLLLYTFSGLMGFSLGPVIAEFMRSPGGAAIVTEAAAGTAIDFAALSAYAWISRRDFQFMRGFLFTGLIIAVIGSIAGIFLHIELLHLVIAGIVLLVFSGLVLFDTSLLIQQRGIVDPVLMAVSLYLDALNIFMALLQILGLTQGGRRN